MRWGLLFLWCGCSTWLCGQLLVEEFDGGTLPPGWTTTDASANAEPLLWQVCPDPTTCAPFTTAFTTGLVFGAPGAQNGYVTANSDAHGQQPTDFISRLRSPVVDCSEAPRVYLSFYSFLATALLPASEHAIVQVRSAGGSWVDFRPFCTLQYGETNQQSTNAQWVVLDISEVAAGSASVELRWQWTGDWEYSWSIDGVRLTPEDPRAERVVWGALPGQGDFAGGLNGWTVNTLLAPGPLQGWRWSPDGYFGDAFFAADTRHLDAPTVCNGAVVLNADHYSTGGDTPIDPPYPIYVSELVSPPVDLGTSDEPLSLSFYETVRQFEPAPGYAAPTQLAYSTDDGTTWSAPVDLHPDLPQSEERTGRLSVPLPEALSGAAAVRIKFIFAAQFFYWIIDDVRIERRRAVDLALTPTYAALAPSAVVPASQVDSVFFLTDLRNNGSDSADAVVLHVAVDDLLTSTTPYADSLEVGAVGPSELRTDLLLPHAFLPPAEPGLYEYRYRVGGALPDEFLPDNGYQNRLQVSDTTFAKERGRTRAIAPTGAISRYAYGNCFYVPRGAGYRAASVSFGLANAADLAGDAVLVHLYEWAGDLNENDRADAELEYTELGINGYTITGGEGNNLITVPLLSPDGGPLDLQDDRYYLATVEYDGLSTCFFQASEAYNYTATYVLTDSLQRPRYASVLRTDFTDDSYDLIGFGLDVVPVVRFHIREKPTATARPRTVSIRVFPNPISDLVRWSTAEKRDFQHVRVARASGQVLTPPVPFARGRLRTDGLASGAYLLVFTNKSGQQHAVPILVQR